MGIDAKVKKNGRATRGLDCGTTGIRTWDTRIFSPLLYQLSYGTKRATAKINKFSCLVGEARPTFAEEWKVDFDVNALIGWQKTPFGRLLCNHIEKPWFREKQSRGVNEVYGSKLSIGAVVHFERLT